MEKLPPVGEIIELLACDIEARPSGAPGPSALAPHIRGVQRSAAALTISFAPEAFADVEALAAAERVCCAGIGWDVRRDPVTLTITASPAQLDAIAQIFEPA